MTSEDLEPLFAKVIGVRHALLTRKTGMLTPEGAATLRQVVETLGDLARAANATHAAICCDNYSRNLRFLEIMEVTR